MPSGSPPASSRAALEAILRPSVRVRSLDDVVGQLREIVRSGAVAPGDRLPSERELSRMLNVSRTTVREALRAVEATGLVEIRLGGQGGAFVRAPSAGQVGSALSMLLMLEGASEHDLTEYRAAFEPENAALAATRADEAERDVLRSILERARQLPGTADGWSAIESLDFELHQLLPTLTHNAVRVAIAHGIHDALRRSFDRVEPLPASTAVLRDEVIRVLEAVLSGDEAAARVAMAEHIAGWPR